MIRILIKSNKIFLVIFTIMALLLVGIPSNVYAVEESGNHIKIEPLGNDKESGIFSDKDGLWYPGRTLEKGFIVKSNSEKEIQFNKFFIDVKPLSSNVLDKIFNIDDDLYKRFSKYLEVTLKDNNSVFFEGTFEDFSNNGVVLNSPIKVVPNSQKDFTLALHFDEQAGNEFQDLTQKFSLAIQYTLTDEASGIDTEIPTTGTGAGGVSIDNGNLPRTGRFMDYTAMLFLGLMLLAAGFFLFDFNKNIIRKIFRLKGEK